MTNHYSKASRNTSPSSLAISALVGLYIFLLGMGEALAMPIDKTLTVNVITICDNNGNNCASQGPLNNLFFAAEVNKIWAQAGIHFDFVLQPNLNDINHQYINDSVTGRKFSDLSKSSNTTVTMWLARQISGAYGESWLGLGDLIIAMDSVMSAMRLDTIAHELGHNLGLVHSAASNTLMATNRNIPSSLADIAPDGFGYDLLTPDQIAIARNSALLHDIATVPEPASLALLVIGSFVFVAGMRRRAPIRIGA